MRPKARRWPLQAEWAKKALALWQRRPPVSKRCMMWRSIGRPSGALLTACCSRTAARRAYRAVLGCDATCTMRMPSERGSVMRRESQRATPHRSTSSLRSAGNVGALNRAKAIYVACYVGTLCRHWCAQSCPAECRRAIFRKAWRAALTPTLRRIRPRPQLQA
jgi:hypothetical protein